MMPIYGKYGYGFLCASQFPVWQYGISLSAKMAKLLGLQVGDFVEWHMVGEKDWEKTRISALYTNVTIPDHICMR